ELRPDQTPVIKITGSDPDSRLLFLQALRTPNERVILAGSVDLDLSGLVAFPVAEGGQIIGEPDADHPGGPRLFTTSRPKAGLAINSDNRLIDGFNGMLAISSNGVRISGLRFDGQESTDPCDEANQPDFDAIDIYSSDVAIDSVEIDH